MRSGILFSALAGARDGKGGVRGARKPEEEALMGVPPRGPAQPAAEPAPAAVRAAQRPRKELRPILLKGQLRRFRTPPVAHAPGGDAAAGLTFQASWDNVDLTPPARYAHTLPCRTAACAKLLQYRVAYTLPLARHVLMRFLTAIRGAEEADARGSGGGGADMPASAFAAAALDPAAETFAVPGAQRVPRIRFGPDADMKRCEQGRFLLCCMLLRAQRRVKGAPLPACTGLRQRALA